MSSVCHILAIFLVDGFYVVFRLRDSDLQPLPAPVHEPSDPQLRRFATSRIARRMFDPDSEHEEQVHSAVNQAIHGQHRCSVLYCMSVIVRNIAKRKCCVRKRDREELNLFGHTLLCAECRKCV